MLTITNILEHLFKYVSLIISTFNKGYKSSQTRRMAEINVRKLTENTNEIWNVRDFSKIYLGVNNGKFDEIRYETIKENGNRKHRVARLVNSLFSGPEGGSVGKILVLGPRGWLSWPSPRCRSTRTCSWIPCMTVRINHSTHICIQTQVEFLKLIDQPI